MTALTDYSHLIFPYESHRIYDMVQQRAKRKGDNDWLRREQNRQAQHAFRQRRKVAQDAQRHRVKHLEDSVEEMSKMLVGFCDEMLGTEEIARQPRLMARLQASMERALALARSVSKTDEDIAATETANAETADVQDDGRKEASLPATQPSLGFMDGLLSQSPSYDRPPFVESPDDPAPFTLPLNMWESLHGEIGSGLFTPPPFEQTSPQTRQPKSDTAPFALRLVEVTLSQACLYLNGDVYLSTEEITRAFGSSLRHRTLDQLLAYMRWLLGPGKNEMHAATGISWNTTSSREAGVNSLSSGTPDTSRHCYGPDLQPELMTALAIQEQLQNLGARDLGSDMMELKIDRSESLEAGTATSGYTLNGYEPGHKPEAMVAAGLVMRLKTSLLATNLANVAMCLEKGPIYPRDQVFRAIKDSVILANWV